VWKSDRSLHPAPQFFDRAALLFAVHHPPLHAPGARPVLAADLFAGGLLTGLFRPARLFQRGKQSFAGKLPVHRLGTGILHRYGNPARRVAQGDGGGNFVDVLTARSRGTRKALLYVVGAKTQAGEARGEIVYRRGRGGIHYFKTFPMEVTIKQNAEEVSSEAAALSGLNCQDYLCPNPREF